jgi:hypothetical protein
LVELTTTRLLVAGRGWNASVEATRTQNAIVVAKGFMVRNKDYLVRNKDNAKLMIDRVSRFDEVA